MLAQALLLAPLAPWWRLVELALSLGLVAAALLLIARLLRQRGQGGANRRLRLVERLVLEPRRSLHLVELDGEVLLVGTSERGVEVLHRSPPTAAADAAPATETKAAAGAP